MRVRMKFLFEIDFKRIFIKGFFSAGRTYDWNGPENLKYNEIYWAIDSIPCIL